MPLGSPFPQEKAGPVGWHRQPGLGRAQELTNGQEKRFHYAGMSGEGEGSLPTPASPAALIDVPCTAAASGPGGRRPLAVHPSWSRASSQMFPAFGEQGWGQGRPAAGRGQSPRCQASASFSAAGLPGHWACCCPLAGGPSPWAWTLFRMGDSGPHAPCADGRSPELPGKGL